MTDYKEYEDVATEDYIVVKALSEGVQVIGLTRGGETRSHHTEMLDAGEVLVAQFTTKTSIVCRRWVLQLQKTAIPNYNGQ